jgi:ATPase subunit of ABC transporter with duplicated ATPase domains
MAIDPSGHGGINHSASPARATARTLGGAGPSTFPAQMIAFSHISKQYGRQVLFVDASFQLNPGERVGLVGPNGAGKTTLFRMIVGEESPDEGDVAVPKRLTIGYFRQDVEEMSGRSVLDETIAGSGRVGTLHHELEALQHAMADPDQAGDMDRILARFGEVQEAYEHLGGYALEAQAREVLLGLGFDDERIDGDVGALSGGWKMRVAMARALLGNPDVLLMDEPTNHLDIESILWLEAFLESRPSALLMTSHDREFMNRIVTRIAEIDGGEITVYSGNYDFYERERALREANREAAYARQQAMLAKERRFIERFAAHAAKAAQVQSRVKALDKIEKVQPPKKRRVVTFDFRPPPRSGDLVATFEDVCKAYGRRVVHAGLNLTIRRGERWAVMGRNGAGKTTLLRMLAGVLAPDAGTIKLGASLKMGYFAQQALDVLEPDLTIEEQLTKDFPLESTGVLRNLAGAFQFSGDDIDKKIRTLSGGEKTRLVMARMLLDPPNLLVLDEPTNHLDLATKEMLVESLGAFDGTMVFVSHDRAFLRGLSNRVLELGGETGTDADPHVYPGSYVEYVQRTGHEAPGVHT